MNTERQHAIDAARAWALLLGIFLHASMAYLPGFREVRWPISDASTGAPLGVLFFAIHAFRMTLFFMIAGFCARALRERAGTAGFLKNRGRRIALPLLAFYVVVTPLTFIAFIWGMRRLGVAGPPLIPPPAPLVGPPVPWGHLWFLYLLLVVCCLAAAGRAIVARVDPRGLLRDALARLLRGAIAARIAPLLLALPVAAALALAPWWQQWQAIPAPIVGLVPNAVALLVYGGAFCAGWLLHREMRSLPALASLWPFHLALFVVAIAVSLWIGGITPRFGVLPMSPPARLAYAFAYAVAGWSGALGLLGVATRYLEQAGTRWRYLSDASYWMYLVHLPIVWLLQVWMMPWPLHWAVKLTLVLTITSAALLLSYQYFVRGSFVGVFLNGRRYARAQPVAISTPSISPG